MLPIDRDEGRGGGKGGNAATPDDGDSQYQAAYHSMPDDGKPHASAAAHHHHQPPKRLESHAPFTRPADAHTTSGLVGTTSNLINTIVGAGIIGMPYAVRQSGLVAGIILIVLVGFLTDKSLNLLVTTAAHHPRLKSHHIRTYEDTMYYPYGLPGRAFVLLSMFAVAYGAMVAYFIIIKDTIPTIIGFNDEEKYQPELVLVVVSAVIILPLSMMKDMASLAVTSLLSVTCDVILVFYVVLCSPVSDSVAANGGLWNVIKQGSAINPNVFVGLGILSTAMCCQHSSFLIYGSLHNNTRKRWSIVSAISIGTATFLCLILGVAGYLGFGDETEGDVLNNFPEGSVTANVARALLAVTMVFTYPMESFVGRHVLVDLIHNGQIECDLSQREARGERMSWWDRMLLNRRERMTLTLYVLTLLPALYFDDLGPVLSITGAVGGSCLAYVGPGLVYLGIYSREVLDMCHGWLGYHYTGGGDHGSREGTLAVELPTMKGGVDASNREHSYVRNEDEEEGGNRLPPSSVGWKPIWWYVLGFPMWVGIATRANEGMKTRLDEERKVIVEERKNSGNEWDEASLSTCAGEEELPPPTAWDVALAIFFVVFGVVALVAGLGSNLYVQFREMIE